MNAAPEVAQGGEVYIEAEPTPRPKHRGYRGTPLNKQYVTLECGHQFAARQKPHGGCKTCWKAFFLNAPDIAHGVGLILDSQDSSWREKLLAGQGAEFLKQAKFFHQSQQESQSQKEVAQ